MADLDRVSWLDDVPLEVEAVVPASSMPVNNVLALRPGSLISSLRLAGENIDLLAGQAKIGAGELSAGGIRTVMRLVRLG